MDEKTIVSNSRIPTVGPPRVSRFSGATGTAISGDGGRRKDWFGDRNLPVRDFEAREGKRRVEIPREPRLAGSRRCRNMRPSLFLGIFGVGLMRTAWNAFAGENSSFALDVKAKRRSSLFAFSMSKIWIADLFIRWFRSLMWKVNNRVWIRVLARRLPIQKHDLICSVLDPTILRTTLGLRRIHVRGSDLEALPKFKIAIANKQGISNLGRLKKIQNLLPQIILDLNSEATKHGLKNDIYDPEGWRQVRATLHWFFYKDQ